jgi:DNA polymerase-4
MILHIDMDAFFASIEQAVNPRLKGKPLIVGSRGNKLHTVVCAASYEAKRLGISSGMSTRDALNICPALEFVPAEQGKYIWTSEQVLELIKGQGYPVDYVSIDEFRLDVGSLKNPVSLAKSIQEQIYANFNITASIGIAGNCLLSKLASKLNKPNGIAQISPDNLVQTLNNTPAGKLCGVGAKTEELLDAQGIKTCLDLYQKSPRFLEALFGKYGLNLYASLHSVESLEVSGEPEKPKSIGHSYTLPRATKTPGFIRAWLRLLSEMVAQRLRQDNLVSETVHLWLNGPEIGNFGAQKTSQIATNDGREIYARSLRIMARLGLKEPKIRALGVTCGGLKVAQEEALFEEIKRRDRLLKVMDTINSRFGDSTIYPAQVTLTRKFQ